MSWTERFGCGRCHRSTILTGPPFPEFAVVPHASWCGELKEAPDLVRSVLENEADPPDLQTASELLATHNEARRRLANMLLLRHDLSLMYLIETVLFKLQALGEEGYQVERVLGIALGYPLGEEGGPCPGEPVVGEHTPLTLADEAASRLRGISDG